MYRSIRNTAAIATAFSLAALGAACSDKNVTALSDETQIISSVRSDANIMGVLHQSNVNEIAEATLAVTTASDTGVRAFAQRMIADHTTLDQQGNALAAQLKITPVLPDSVQIVEQANAIAQLRTNTGTGFDRAYINEQVRDHQQTLALVDSMTQLAQNAALRTALQTQIRPIIATHLQLSQQLQTRIGK